MMDDRARIALRDLVAEKGESILASRERLRGMLSDDCPECSKEINILMIAVQAQVPSELRAHSSATDPKIALNAGIMRLERAFGLGRPAAAWAVLALANAVGKLPEDRFAPLLAELGGEPGPAPTPPAPIAAPPPPPPPPPVAKPWTPPPPPINRPPSQAATQPVSTPPATPPPSRPASVPPPAPPPSPVYPQPAVPPPPVVQPPPQQPFSPPMRPPLPVAPPTSSKGKGIAIGIGIGLVVAVLGVYSLTRHSGGNSGGIGNDQPKSSEPRSSEPDVPRQTPPNPPGSAPDQPGQTPPASGADQPPSPSGFGSYADSSGFFQVPVPNDWVFRRAETDTTVDNAPTHFVHAAVFGKSAEKSDLDGWVSEGIRVSLYLPPKGKVWKPDWSAEWQKRMFNASLQGYSRYQNTTIESVQLGNIQASTTAVMGEAKQISEPEVARLYVSYTEKYLITVEVAMPSSKRAQFEALDDAVRRSFELKVP